MNYFDSKGSPVLFIMFKNSESNLQCKYKIKFTAEVLKCYVYYTSHTILTRDGSRKLVTGLSCGFVDNYYR